MQSRKSLLSVIVAACAMAVITPVVFCSIAFAEPTPHPLKDMNFTGGDQGWIVECRFDVNDYGVFTDTPRSYGSTNESVAFLDPNYNITMYSASVIPCGVGDCIIWLGDGDTRASSSTIAEVKVHVTEAGLKRFMKEYHSVVSGTGIYGSKKLEVGGPPYASYSIVIGNDTYSGTFSREGWASIVLNSIYKLNAKVTYNILSGGVTSTWDEKIVNGTDVEKVKVLKGRKKIKVKLENPHKGDVLKLKYAKKTYTLKIKKDYDGKKHTWTMKLKKKMKANSKFSFSIKNKYKQTLTKQKQRLWGNTYWKYDEETHED